MLEKYAKRQSLRVYLFSFSQFYDNVSIDWITENFEMSSSEVQSTVSKLMINEELKASWDEPSRSLVLHKTEPTRLQVLIFENQISNGFFRTWHFNLLLAWISLPKATNDFVNPSRDPTSPPSTNPTAWEVTLVISSSLLKFIRFRLVAKQQPSVLNLIWVNRKDRVLSKSKLLSNLILLNSRNHHLL